MKEMVLVCEVRGHKIGVDAGQIAEILNVPLVKRIPTSKPAFCGVVNVRGDGVPVYDAGKLFWNEFIPVTVRTQMVILKHSKGLFGLIVDRVFDIEETDPENIEPVNGLYGLIPGIDRVLKKDTEVLPLIDSEVIYGAHSLSLDEEVEVDFTEENQDFDEETISILKERARSLAKKPVEKKSEFQGLLLVRIADQNFAFKIEHVREIIRPSKITYVPGTPEHFSGVLTFRGEIIPVIEASVLLCQGMSKESGKERIVLVSANSETVGIKVDEVISLLFIEEDAVEMPVHSKGNISKLIVSEVYVDGNLYSIINPDAFFDAEPLMRS